MIIPSCTIIAIHVALSKTTLMNKLLNIYSLSLARVYSYVVDYVDQGLIDLSNL